MLFIEGGGEAFVFVLLSEPPKYLAFIPNAKNNDILVVDSRHLKLRVLTGRWMVSGCDAVQ